MFSYTSDASVLIAFRFLSQHLGISIYFILHWICGGTNL